MSMNKVIKLDNNATRMVELITEYGTYEALRMLERDGMGKMERAHLLRHALRLMGTFNNVGKTTRGREELLMAGEEVVLYK